MKDSNRKRKERATWLDFPYLEIDIGLYSDGALTEKLRKGFERVSVTNFIFQLWKREVVKGGEAEVS